MKPKEYLIFEELTQLKPTRKTKTWYIRNKVSGDYLGNIRWRPGWRRYVVRFITNVEFDYGCLWELTNFLNNAMMQYNIRKEQANGKAKETPRHKVSQRIRVQR